MIKKKRGITFIASLMMLVAMTLASCKSSNKPAAETSRIGEIPEAAQYIVGLEKFNTPIDYSQAECWLDVPAAMVKDAIPADGAAMFGPENYHLHDYGFFFNNFKQNVADRIKVYLEK